MRLEPLQVAEEEVGPLVGGEAAGEADGEGARVEDAAGPVDVAGGGPALLELARRRRRAKATRRSRRRSCVAQSSSSGILSIRSQVSASPGRRDQSGPR